ncbi:hypothetical protein PENSPDRAFT_648077 [Peniophora sp. CONT]|nr:hypothetical protein PENSPDRAFT_648077 [Peniophora sp. CONT]
MSARITFYDLRFKSGLPTSPNAWKTRFTLNYKGLPYKTTYLNFVDIKSTFQAKNIPPSQGDAYTVPAIFDHATGKAVSDSARIAEYLDSQYPDTPPVYSPSTREAQIAFEGLVRARFGFAVLPLILLDIYDGVEDKDKEYWRRTREALFKGPLESIVPQGEKRTAQLESVRAGLDVVAKEIAEHAGEGALFFGGDSPCFADITLAATFKSILIKCDPEFDACKVILSNEWAAKYIDAFEKWASIEN